MTVFKHLKRRLSRAWLAFWSDPADPTAVLIAMTPALAKKRGLDMATLEKAVPALRAPQELGSAPSGPSVPVKTVLSPAERLAAMEREVLNAEDAVRRELIDRAQKRMDDDIEDFARETLERFVSPLVVEAHRIANAPVRDSRILIERIEDPRYVMRRVRMWWQNDLVADRNFRLEINGQGIAVHSIKDNLENRQGPADADPVAA